jgi:DNA-binding MarR family transcriptional regulator
MASLSQTQPHRTSRRFDSLEQEAFLNLWRTYDRLRAAEDELFGRHELTPQQYNSLRLLKAEHPARLPTLALAEKLVSRAPDITRLIDKLAERGLVERERPAENRRVVHVGITSKGIGLLEELTEQVQACHHKQLGHVSASRLRQLIELLKEARAPHEDQESSWR